jgi:hypothetical protein
MHVEATCRNRKFFSYAAWSLFSPKAAEEKNFFHPSIRCCTLPEICGFGVAPTAH